MRIDTSGNVGIGTTSPDTNLEISDTSGGVLRLSGTTGGGAGATPYDIGSIEFKSDDSSTGGQRVVATVKTEADTASTVPGGELAFETCGSSSSGSLAERMRIDSSGNVGIGTSSPSQALEINGAGARIYLTDNNEDIDMDSSANGQLFLDGNGYAGAIALNDEGMQIYHNSASRDLIFGTNETERMQIQSGGRIGIGTSSPGGAIHVNTINYTNNGIFQTTSDSFTPIFISFRKASGTQIGSIRMTGTTGTAYNTSSDHRLKENITEITDGINRLKQLDPKRFNFIDEPDTIVDGFIAHEAQTVVPEAVTGTYNEIQVWSQEEIDNGYAPDGVSAGDNKLDENGNTIPEYQGIDQAKLVPLLTAALQEAITKIETLETKVAALEGN